MNSRHSFVLLDRGQEHRHRWKPECSCGWVGVQRRRKKEAVKQHRRHVAVITRHARDLPPRPCTPVACLPDALK